MENKTFYPDLSKNYEFIERINKILYRPNSSILICSILKDSSPPGEFLLSLESFLEKSHPLAFYFNKSSQIILDKNYEKYIKDGFAKEDIELLVELFNDFALSNHYESQFFCSLFFSDEFKKLKKYKHTYILKYIINESKNMFLIDEMKVGRFYAVSDIETVKEALRIGSYRSHENGKLIPCHTNFFEKVLTIDSVMKKFKSISEKEENYKFVIVEHYFNYETHEGFLKDVFEIENDKLNKIKIND